MAERLVSRDPNRAGQISRVVYTRIETRGSRAAAGVLAWRMLFQRRSLGIRLDSPRSTDDTTAVAGGEGIPGGDPFSYPAGWGSFFHTERETDPRRRGDPRGPSKSGPDTLANRGPRP